MSALTHWREVSCGGNHTLGQDQRCGRVHSRPTEY